MTQEGTSWPRPRAVLVPTDFSAPARRALEVALAWFSGADVTLLHVLDTDLVSRIDAHGIAPRSEVLARLRNEAEGALGSLREEFGAEAFETMVVEGSPFIEIVKLARDLAVDVIVMGMRSVDRRLGELLTGSTAERVLRASHCPVIAVP